MNAHLRSTRPLSILVASTLLGACASQVPQLDPHELDAPRLAIAPPAPEADALMSCFGRRLGRYFDPRSNGVPPVLVEVTSFVNRNPSSFNRLDLPSDATTMIESLLSAVGSSLAFRRDSGPPRPGDPLVPMLKLKGEIQSVEVVTKAATKSWDLSVFFSNADASARDAGQATLASITVAYVGRERLQLRHLWHGGTGAGGQVPCAIDERAFADVEGVSEEPSQRPRVD